jgi:hypothetical protein
MAMLLIALPAAAADDWERRAHGEALVIDEPLRPISPISSIRSGLWTSFTELLQAP